MMDPGAFLARGVSKKAMRNAAEVIQMAKSTDGSISRGSAQRCAEELTAIFLRSARQKTTRATARAGSRSHGSANHVERRVGAIYSLLDDIATGQARATDDDARETMENSLATRRDGSVARSNRGDCDRDRDRDRHRNRHGDRRSSSSDERNHRDDCDRDRDRGPDQDRDHDRRGPNTAARDERDNRDRN